MAALCWVVVTVTLWISTGTRSAAVDQNQLKPIVEEILNRYRPSYEAQGTMRYPMFSVALSIPYNQGKGKYDMGEVHDGGQQVRKKILDCDVFTSNRMVAATVLRWPNVVSQCPDGRVQWRVDVRNCPQRVNTWADVQRHCPQVFYDGRADHAEYRILQHFNSLLSNRNPEDLMVFYVLASPCSSRCTNENSNWNILTSIEQVKKWDNYAVVFSDVFKPRNGPDIPEAERRRALERLGQSIGLSNIFRCNEQNNDMQCTSCSTGGHVTQRCFTDGN